MASPRGDESALAGLITDYLGWVLGELEREYGIDGITVDPEETIRSLAAFRPPRGLAVIAEIEGRPAGVEALRQLEPGVVEVKRMYVHPDFRELHLLTWAGSHATRWNVLAVSRRFGTRYKRLADSVRTGASRPARQASLWPVDHKTPDRKFRKGLASGSWIA